MTREEMVGRAAMRKLESLCRNKKASGHYWNADDWGSISGFLDAEEWVAVEFGRWVLSQSAEEEK